MSYIGSVKMFKGKSQTIWAASSKLSTARIFIGLVAIKALASSTRVPREKIIIYKSYFVYIYIVE